VNEGEVMCRSRKKDNKLKISVDGQQAWVNYTELQLHKAEPNKWIQTTDTCLSISYTTK